MNKDGECATAESMTEIDVSGVVPLLAPARRILAILAALDAEAQVEVIAAHADCSSTAALRHLQHLARIGLAESGKADPRCFRAASGPGPCHPEVLTIAGHAAAIAWHLTCVFEAARVLGAAALPTGEQISPDPARPPRTPVGRAAALAWFTVERENLERVLELAYELGEHAQGWRLALLMLDISCFTGPWDRWRQVYERGAAAARQAHHRGALAMFEEAAGKLELTGGDPVAARERHQRALVMRSTNGDALGVVRSLNALGVAFLREGSMPEAGALFAWTLGLADELGDEEFATFARMNLGAVHARTGPAAVAVKELQDAIRALRAAGRDPYVANALEDLAVAYRLDGDQARSQQAALEAIEVAVDAGVPMFLPGPLIEHAHILAENGHLHVALARLHEARAIYSELGDQLREVRTENQIDRLTGSLTAPA